MLCAILAAVAGAGCRGSASRERHPPARATAPRVEVRIEAPGYTASELERVVAVPLEIATRGLRGVTSIESMCRRGRVAVVLELDPGVEMLAARRMVLERALATELPEGLHAELAPAAISHVCRYRLRSRTRSASELRELQDWRLGPELRRTPGVMDVAACGGDHAETVVGVSAAKLAAYGLGIAAVAGAVELKATAAPGGHADLEDIASVPVDRRGDGIVLVKDLAEVTATARPDGCQARDANTGLVEGIVAVATASALAAVRGKLGELRSLLPAGTSLELVGGCGATAPLHLRIGLAAAEPDEVTQIAGRIAGVADSHGLTDFVLEHGIEDPTAGARLSDEVDLSAVLASEPAAEQEQRLRDAIGRERAIRGIRRIDAGSREQVAIVSILGDDLATLHAIAAGLGERISGIAGVIDVVAIEASIGPELSIVPDRSALARLGVSPADVRSTAAAATVGIPVGMLRGDPPRQIYVRSAEGMDEPAALAQALIVTPAGAAVPMAQLARLERADAPRVILRRDGRRSARLLVRLDERVAERALREVDRSMKRASVPVGYVVQLVQP